MNTPAETQQLTVVPTHDDGTVREEPRRVVLTESDLDEITNLTWRCATPRFEQSISDILADDVFQRVEGLTDAQATQLCYDRLRHVCARAGLQASDLTIHPEKLFALHDWLGFVDPTVCTLLSIHYSLCLGSIVHHGAGRSDLSDYVSELERLESVGVFLVTELGYGNNVVSLETRAVYDPATREFDLHTPTPQARKWMPNTAAPGVPKLAVVMARLVVGDVDHGVYPFIVRLSDERGPMPGVNITPLGEKAGYHLDNGMTAFVHVRIPKRNLLAGEHSRLEDDGSFHCSVRSRRKRFLDALDRVQAGRLNLTGGAVSTIRGAAHIALSYSQQRMTFAPRHPDVPIIRYRNQQRDIFGATALAFAGGFAVKRARGKWIARTEDNHDACMREISVVKAFISYRAADAIARCRERCGAAGLFSENRFLPWWVANQGLITAEGDNQVILLKSARQMAMREGYETLSLRAHIDPAGRDLEDLEFQRALFRFREIHRIEELRLGLQSGITANASLFDAWNANVNLAIEAAEAHGARLVFESFLDGLGRYERPGSRRALRELCRLFGLQELRRDAGWLLANGAITSLQTKGLPHAQDRVCDVLLPAASELGDALAVPQSLVATPLQAESYIDAYSAKTKDRDLL
jgi:acyl-CoA oxidase